jgi:hypothetical protein
VWETRKVRKQASHNQFTSPHLPSVLPTNIENVLGHAPATYAPRKYVTSPPPSNQCQRVCSQANARMKRQTQGRKCQRGANCPTGVRLAQRKVERPNAMSTAPIPYRSMAGARVRPHTLAFDRRVACSAGDGSFKPHCEV